MKDMLNMIILSQYNNLAQNIFKLTCNVHFGQYIFDIRLRCCIIYFNKSCRNKTEFD